MDLTGGTFSTTSGLELIRDMIYYGEVNDAQYSVLSQMARSTADPALALQAYFSTICGVIFWDRINMFDTVAPSSRVSLVQATQPLGWTSYTIVVSLVVLHCLLVFIFHRAGKLSRIGNAWAAISQILGPTTENWIRDVDIVDDKTVSVWLKARGLHEVSVHIESIQGHVQLVTKNK
jgi:hypothetical protein